MTFGPQRGHIACIFENFFKDFGLLILAIVIGLIQGNMDLIWENLGVLVIVLMGPISRIVFYLNTRYTVDEEKLLIQSGWLKKNTLEVPLSTITTVDFTQNIFHQIFGVYRLNIDNNSNISNSNTKIHMTLSKSDAEMVKHLLMKGREGLDGMNYAAEMAETSGKIGGSDVDMPTKPAAPAYGRRYDIPNWDLLLMGALKSKGVFFLEFIGVLAAIVAFVPDDTGEQMAESAAVGVDQYGLGIFLLGFIVVFFILVYCN